MLSLCLRGVCVMLASCLRGVGLSGMGFCERPAWGSHSRVRFFSTSGEPIFNFQSSLSFSSNRPT